MNELVSQTLRQLSQDTIERLGAAPMTTLFPASDATEDERSPTELPNHEPHAGADLEMRQVLAEGGMGRVTLARQRSLDRDVAVKSLAPKRRSPRAQAALLAEARCAGALEHPNIVPIHALGSDAAGGPLIVMKRIEGVSLATKMREWRRDPGALERGVEILIQVCNAVHFAHTRGVIHRDIKPDNVMLGDFGEVYLVDWGIAMRMSERERATALAGSPAYMAPEMLVGGLALLPQTDVYLLGATLYELMFGHPPHRGADLAAVLESVAQSNVQWPDQRSPRALTEICRRALDPLPQRRFLGADELREALSQFLRHQASSRLAEQALLRLDEARRAELGAARRRMLVECQFGLRQALREHAENADALEGLNHCLIELARLEIADGNAGAAESLIAELTEVPDDVRSGLASLRSRLEREEELRVRLARLERDRDFGVSRRTRLGLLITQAVLAPAVSFYYVVNPSAATPAAIVHGWIIHSAVIGVAIFVMRRALFENEVNRKLTLTVLMLAAIGLVHRIASLWLARSATETVIEDMFLIGLGYAIGGGLLFGWAGIAVGAIAVALACTAIAHPDWTAVLSMIEWEIPVWILIARWWRPPKS